MGSMLDLRGTPTWDRHELVCGAFSELALDDTLHLVYDYEPRPLRRRFQRTFPQRYVWEQRRVTTDRWEIAVRKVDTREIDDAIRRFLERCPVIAVASEATRETLAREARVLRCDRNTTIAEQDAEWPFLGVVRNGRVFAIAVSPNGRDQILFEAHETDLIGNMVIFDGGRTLARFATLSEGAEIILIPKDAVLQAAAADGRFAISLGASGTQHTRTIIELVSAHVSKRVVERVAAALLPYAPLERGLLPVDPAHYASIRPIQIAVATGTVKEVVGRALAVLERNGAILRRKGNIVSADRSKLRRADTM